MRRYNGEFFIAKGYTKLQNEEVVELYEKLKSERKRKKGYCVPVAFFIRESMVGDGLTCLIRQLAIRPISISTIARFIGPLLVGRSKRAPFLVTVRHLGQLALAKKYIAIAVGQRCASRAPRDWLRCALSGCLRA